MLSPVLLPSSRIINKPEEARTADTFVRSAVEFAMIILIGTETSLRKETISLASLYKTIDLRPCLRKARIPLKPGRNKNEKERAEEVGE